jgi:putative flippase GtrA
VNQESKYRQLAMFSTVVAEVVVTPSALGGAVYYFTHETSWTGVAALVGLVIAFYRIYLLNRRWSHAKSD